LRAIRPHTNTDTYGNCYTGAKSYANANFHSDGNGHLHAYTNTDSNRYSHSNINADRHRDANADSHSHSHPGRYNQCRNERRKFFCYTQWLSQSARVNHDSLFSVWDNDQLRAHDCLPDQDREHIPECQRKRHRLSCEHHLSFPNCSHQQWWHQLWQRQDIYRP
jgi:hypothetical protein